jgi:hypothetical protein
MGHLACLLTVLLPCIQLPAPTAHTGPTFSRAGNRATSTLLDVYYTGHGRWRACDLRRCAAANVDWGDDSLTYTLALRSATGDSNLQGVFNALTSTASRYRAPCRQIAGCNLLSDRPEWDAVALAEEYDITKNPAALAKSEAAFSAVAGSQVYSGGACPSILYQKAGGGDTHAKTLESQANAVRAALLLYSATGSSSYLAYAIAAYDAARNYFLDPHLPLYTVYVMDDGRVCRQVPRRFFASVNGLMIWNGTQLFQDTNQISYLQEAIQTGQAVDTNLSDSRGIYTDMEAENDVEEPLVEGMLALAVRGQAFARSWLLGNAAAALSARTHDGSFGRFFDGPPPAAKVTAWQTNGGLALEIAAAALAPNQPVSAGHPWDEAKHVRRQITKLPSALSFRGSGIALIGTLGEQCCTSGHARVVIDGHPTIDETGIWQNKDALGRPIPNTILFSWRWPSSGRHRLRFLPGIANSKEGGAFLHLVGYEVLQ